MFNSRATLTSEGRTYLGGVSEKRVESSGRETELEKPPFLSSRAETASTSRWEGAWPIFGERKT